MDIVDVMLARALTPQGQIESYAAQSQTAIAKANDAVANLESITEQTQQNSAKAEEALAAVNIALENITSAENRIEEALESLQVSTTDQVDDEIKKLAIDLVTNSNDNYYGLGLQTSYPNDFTRTIQDAVKMYKSTGDNEDGTMTQKAITSRFEKMSQDFNAEVSKLSTAIKNSSGGNSGTGGISNLGIDNEGKIVIIGPNGTIQPGNVEESDIVEALIKSGSYDVSGTLGLVIDYENKLTTRGQESKDKDSGSAFDAYVMFGGRMRCNVADDGTIKAFYGDANYTEDGSNGQVMVYQPKFYYQRTVFNEEPVDGGNVVRKESLILSAEKHSGFKVHPLFKSGDDELDYVLLPAYEGSLYDDSANTYVEKDDVAPDTAADKLSSIANVKPLNGAGKSISVDDLRALATNRGEGWSLTNIQFESAMQMLEVVEFGGFNGQDALGKGVVNITVSNAIRGAAITGSTSALGNASGQATSTIFDNNGSQTTQTALDARAITYRGVENPWGNLWRIIDDFTVKGDGSVNGGIPYVGDTSLQMKLPDSSSLWTSGMGHSLDAYDWVYIPIERSDKANSALPIGDTLWTLSSLNGENIVAIGGYYTSKEAAGPFNYSCDMKKSMNINHANGRLMFTPTKNSIYEANIAKWKIRFGG